ncbi:hypothetical protein [Rhizobium sp. RCAM05973]|uniref:hypothetical protein n=1 Tax=Rhizobium sp. RCAM05973 TaxID=2994066 RepID=UPI0022EBB635|nr:hypothetical protein [Rhizobium sp. RCAM05973]
MTLRDDAFSIERRCERNLIALQKFLSSGPAPLRTAPKPINANICLPLATASAKSWATSLTRLDSGITGRRRRSMARKLSTETP